MILSPTAAIKRMLVVGVGVAVAQQAVGIDAIQYYLLDVLKDVLQEDDGPEEKASKQVILVLCVLGILKLFFVVIGSLMLDTRGRKKLLIISLLGRYTVVFLICSDCTDYACF